MIAFFLFNQLCTQIPTTHLLLSQIVNNRLESIYIFLLRWPLWCYIYFCRLNYKKSSFSNSHFCLLPLFLKRKKMIHSFSLWSSRRYEKTAYSHFGNNTASYSSQVCLVTVISCLKTNKYLIFFLLTLKSDWVRRVAVVL